MKRKIALIVPVVLLLGACSQELLDTSIGSVTTTFTTRSAIGGPNGSIDVNGMTENSLTVSYYPGDEFTFVRLYVSEGNGEGLVLAAQDMNYSDGTYFYTLSHPTFTPGAKIYICILKNSNGVEVCIPQGELATVSTWASITYGDDSSSSPGDQLTPNYTLIWADEFNGSSLDASNWTCEIGAGGWGNNELQYYTSRSQNVSVADGNLKITALRENYQGSTWTSARIKTQGKREFKYGKMEARIKLPNGKGLWPAFWMLGANFTSVGWPYCGETDIMEHINSENTVYGTIHWDCNGYASWGQSTLNNYWNNFNVDVTQYHVYSIEWNSLSIKWYVDGIQFMEANIENSINSTEEFHKPFFFILNLAVGGNWPGYPDSSTPSPSTMYVDYVRVYQ